MTPMISESTFHMLGAEGGRRSIDFANVFMSPQWNNLLYNSK